MTGSERAEFIGKALSAGKPKEQIYLDLLGRGELVDDIARAYEEVRATVHREESPKRAIRIILIAAATLVGAGIFSFIASNWQVMGKPDKLTAIVGSMLTAYAFGWYFRNKPGFGFTGEAFTLLGTIIYGAGLFLTAQMYNIRANWPDGFLLWVAGLLAMAYATGSYPLFVLAIPLGCVALVAHPMVILDSLGGSPFLLTSSVLLASSTLLLFFTGVYFSKKARNVSGGIG